MNQEKTGKFIAGARNQLGLTQKELAEKMGVPYPHKLCYHHYPFTLDITLRG